MSNVKYRVRLEIREIGSEEIDEMLLSTDGDGYPFSSKNHIHFYLLGFRKKLAAVGQEVLNVSIEEVSC